jgi:ribosomal protein S12 methylthiotransferase accessory factor
MTTVSYRLPDAPANATPPKLSDVYNALVSPHCGLIKVLVESCRSPEFPQLHIAAAVLSNPAYFCANTPPPVTVPMGAAGAGVDREQCLWSTLGEAAERYCGGIYHQDELYRAAAGELDGPAFAFEDMILYSEEQYDNPSFPFVPAGAATPRYWVAGRNLFDGAPVHLPAQLIYFGLQVGASEMLTQTVSTGLACGSSQLNAIVSGLREILERDVFMSMWLLKYAPTRIEIDAAFAAKLSAGARSFLASPCCEIKLWYLPNEFGAITVLACVEARHGYRMGFGAACHFSLAAACEKAIVEACHTWTWSLRFPQGTVDNAEEQLSGYGNSGDSKDHVSYYLAPDKRHEIAFLLDAPASVAASELEREAVDTSFEQVLGRLRATGRSVSWIDITSADVGSVGLHVTRVLISRIQPLYFGNPDCYASGDRRRLAELAAFWGVAVPAELNMAPHPFP